MYNSPIHSVVEQVVRDELHGIGIVFNSGQLGIFNTIRFCGFEHPHALIGKALVSFTEVVGVHVVLQFEGGLAIEVGMSDKDYEGPEAMVFYGNAGEIVVWQ